MSWNCLSTLSGSIVAGSAVQSSPQRAFNWSAPTRKPALVRIWPMMSLTESLCSAERICVKRMASRIVRHFAGSVAKRSRAFITACGTACSSSNSVFCFSMASRKAAMRGEIMGRRRGLEELRQHAQPPLRLVGPRLEGFAGARIGDVQVFPGQRGQGQILGAVQKSQHFLAVLVFLQHGHQRRRLRQRRGRVRFDVQQVGCREICRHGAVGVAPLSARRIPRRAISKSTPTHPAAPPCRGSCCRWARRADRRGCEP